MNVVTRYSVGMVSMLCVSISVRQIATAIQLSLVFFGLRRSGRYRNGSATFVGISVINQLQSSLLFVNSAFVGVRALSFAAFMPCSVRTKFGSILARYHSECSASGSCDWEKRLWHGRHGRPYPPSGGFQRSWHGMAGDADRMNAEL